MGLTECKECTQAQFDIYEQPNPQQTITGRSQFTSITSNQASINKLTQNPCIEIAYPLTQDELLEFEDKLNPNIRSRLDELEPLKIKPLKIYQYSDRAYFLKQSKSIYLGQWFNGLPHGFGILINLQDQTYYEGMIFVGRPHGFGRRIYNQGNYYEGQFEFGKIANSGLIVIKKEKLDVNTTRPNEDQQLENQLKLDEIITERSQFINSSEPNKFLNQQ